MNTVSLGSVLFSSLSLSSSLLRCLLLRSLSRHQADRLTHARSLTMAAPPPHQQDWEDFTLFEFRAGLMKKTGTQLAADPRRGTVKLLRVREFSLLLFLVVGAEEDCLETGAALFLEPERVLFDAKKDGERPGKKGH